jgi:hypothetical protein
VIRTAVPLDLTIVPFRPHGPDELEGQVLAAQAGQQVATVFFRIPSGQSAEAAISARTAVLTFLLPAMRCGVPVRLDGALDPWSLVNLQAWQEVMAAWRPRRLRPVPIQADRAAALSSTAPARLDAIMAFSGGVDSCHTLWRHREAARGPCCMRAGLMVHGLDIALDRESEFAGAFQRSRTILEAHGARACYVRTNIRELERTFDLDWQHEAHGLFLTACLSTHESRHDVVVIASTYVADQLRLPWGSNPVSDPLMSGPRPLIHDGTAFNKWQKVADFAGDPTMQAHVRVCWEGEQLDRNCGRCFKCLATFAAFQLAGIDAPAAFPSDTCRAQMRTLRLASPQNHELVASMYREACARGLTRLAGDLRFVLRRDASRPAWWTRLEQTVNRRRRLWRRAT